MADDDDRWTVRGVSHEARTAARMAAKRDRQAIGDWLNRAILSQAKSDVTADRAPVVVSPPPTLDDLGDLVGLIRELSDAGAEIPRSVARSAYGLVRVRLLALRRQTSK